MHGQLLSGGRCLNLGLSLYLHHSLRMRAVRSEGSGDLALKHRHFRVLTDQILNKFKISSAGPFLQKAIIFLRIVEVVLLFQFKTKVGGI